MCGIGNASKRTLTLRQYSKPVGEEHLDTWFMCAQLKLSVRHEALIFRHSSWGGLSGSDSQFLQQTVARLAEGRVDEGLN